MIENVNNVHEKSLRITEKNYIAPSAFFKHGKNIFYNHCIPPRLNILLFHFTGIVYSTNRRSTYSFLTATPIVMLGAMFIAIQRQHCSEQQKIASNICDLFLLLQKFRITEMFLCFDTHLPKWKILQL
jgi:hypothetical protein